MWGSSEEKSAFIKLPASDVLDLCSTYISRLNRSADENTHKKAVEVSQQNARKNKAWYRFRKLETDVAVIEKSLASSDGRFWDEHWLIKDMHDQNYRTYCLSWGSDLTNSVQHLYNTIAKDWKLIVSEDHEIIVSTNLVSLMRGY